MTDQNEQSEVEQITREPSKEEVSSSKKREKDPKKVAAGKKLAEYNKKAKEALAREMKREKEQAAIKNEEETVESKSWLPELSFTTVLSVVGLGFTAFDLFMRYREKARSGYTEYKNRIPDLSQVPQIPQPSNILHRQPLDQPKIGML